MINNPASYHSIHCDSIIFYYFRHLFIINTWTEDGRRRAEGGMVIRYMIKDNNGIIRKVRNEG